MVPKKNFEFSTNSYDKYSVKAQERVRRGSSQQLRIDGPANKKSPDIKTFLKKIRIRNSCEKASSRIESCSQPILIVNVSQWEANCYRNP